MMGASDKVTVLTREDVALHNTAKSVWVVVNNKVYDVSEFMFDHPGGEELLLQYGGQDVTKVMKDKLEHEHSESAYDMLDEYCVGVLAPEEGSKAHSKKAVVAEERVGTSKLGTKKPFIDLAKPMLKQMVYSTWSKEYYLEQVHIPRHMTDSAPIFGHPALEMLTKTPWWVIPLVWVPLWSLALYASMHKIGVGLTLQLLPLGVIFWSFLEYTLHRFVFHVEEILPDNRFALSLHFLLHGIHHYLPMDRMRLVMPPALSIIIATCLWNFFSMILPEYLVYGLATGVIPGYVGYDLTHYYLHHGRPFAAHLREMKTYHLDHHYKDANLGYGITSKLWDRLFGTVLY
ncbi:hypothetical protein PhCBS80983_g05764 [Powellomyces hirtus]|uniref:Ceramide very long chain fatty acid hydroxylase n=1 Tax=Powellomyces hirtus TaxID=109895 RepID=A0A507DU75_9FUNG|nr:hypothetical protein PhCBS80983_g05764 [Powellomyces hirtus]